MRNVNQQKINVITNLKLDNVIDLAKEKKFKKIFYERRCWPYRFYKTS